MSHQVLHRLRRANVRQLLGPKVACPRCGTGLRHSNNNRSYCDLCCRRVTVVDVLRGQGLTIQEIIYKFSNQGGNHV